MCIHICIYIYIYTHNYTYTQEQRAEAQLLQREQVGGLPGLHVPLPGEGPTSSKLVTQTNMIVLIILTTPSSILTIILRIHRLINNYTRSP